MIGNILKLMLTRGTKIKRWNNFPRVEYISFLDNIGFVLHIALFLAHLEKVENPDIHIDTIYIIKKIIFESFKGLMLSDINAGTRDYITSIDKEMWNEVEKESMRKIFDLPGLEYIKLDIQETLSERKEREDTIITSARKYSALCECEINAKIYPETFEVPLAIIEKEIEKLCKILPSFATLHRNTKYRKYILQIRRLAHSMRWSGENRLLPISVMSHLVIVTFMSYCIYEIEKQSGKKYSLEALLMKSLYHDIPEAITGDIIAPVKTSVEGFSELLEEVEKQMCDDYLFSYIGTEYKDALYPLLFHPFEDEEGKMVKCADILSALYEAKVEVNFGNTRDYEYICHKLEQKLMNIEAPSIDYLLKNGLFEFSDKNIVQ